MKQFDTYLCKIMTKERRQWSEQQKLQIIQEVEVTGLLPVLRKYDLSQSLFHKWKRRFNEEGVVGLVAKYPKVDPEKRRMEQEIKRLRELVGELSLELRFKEELLKKNQY
jgi:transposase-like protein